MISLYQIACDVVGFRAKRKFAGYLPYQYVVGRTDSYVIGVIYDIKTKLNTHVC